MSEHGTSTDERLVEISGLSRQFGDVRALQDVSLQIPVGSVFGLVGANGAGKTTMIKHVMGLLRPQSGSVSVFGLSPSEDPVGVLSRLGYLSEANDLPGWMRVHELISYTRAFYPKWDDQFARSLQESFELAGDQKVSNLSKGQRARVGLLLALAHRPEMLVLDEPSSGLDPLVRRDILRAIIRTISEEGRTVLFSSHLLDEVERVADHLAIIESGRVVRRGALEDLKGTFHTLSLRFEQSRQAPPAMSGSGAWSGGGQNWSAVFEGELDTWRSTVGAAGAEVVDRTQPSLNDIFVSLVGEPSGAGAHEPELAAAGES